MNSILITIAKFIVAPLVSILTIAGYNVQQPKIVVASPSPIVKVATASPSVSPKITLGNYNPSGGGTYRLKNSIGLSATTINLSSFKEPISNIPYTMTYLNSTSGYGTLDPQTPTKSEFVSFTGITQNSDGSAQLTGVTRGLSRTPGTGGCVASTTLATSHSGQSIFILSDSPCFFSNYAVKSNDETITGYWTVPAPTTGGNPTTKTYVDGIVNGGTVSYDKIAVAGTAGETVSAGQVLYYNQANSQWFKAASTNPEAVNTMLGIAQGAGTAGNAIASGVLVLGLDTNQSGLTTGINYFLSSTAGSITTATTTKYVGRPKTSTSLYFDPSSIYNSYIATSTFYQTATSSVVITATSSLKIGAFPVYEIGKQKKIFTSSGTFSVPWGITKVLVRVVGAGGGGGGGENSSPPHVNGGGGGGGYCEVFADVSATSTIAVTVGTGGVGGTPPGAGAAAPGSAGGDSYFSTFCKATGGLGGGGTAATANLVGVGGAGGVGSLGDINVSGGPGGSGTITAASASTISGNGGNSVLGGGGVAVNSSTAGNAGGNYGGGGGGSVTNGGNTNGGAGAGGIVIVTW